MKRFVAIIVAAVIVYSIYYDIRYGTLPAVPVSSNPTIETNSEKKAQPESKSASPLPYYEKKVTSGDTVLSIIEEQLDDSIPIPISNVVSDFEKLNKGTTPHEIQPGKTYKFPDYSKKQTSNHE